jgi:hypothetical protein
MFFTCHQSQMNGEMDIDVERQYPAQVRILLKNKLYSID